MRAVIQRVSRCSVIANGEDRGSIDTGLLILLGIETEDSQEDVEWLSKKISGLRIFADEAGLMNLSLADVKGQSFVVSQFTLHASTKKGNRPSYIKAARPEQAIPLYEAFIERLTAFSARPVKSGIFGANMQLDFVNDGPVTILIDSQRRE